MAKKKVLLMGKAHSGKTSMRSIIFANYLARDTTRLSPTLDVEHHHVRFLGDLVLNLWDCGGQDAFYESYFERDRETIFRSVELLIYVFDIESESPEKDFDHFCGVLEAIEENSPDARIFVLVHKMDLVAEDDRDIILEDRKRLIEESCATCGVDNFQCFGTSIWDETLYKAWSEIVTNLIPNIRLLETHLNTFCRICDADEVVLFERATFLVISHAQATDTIVNATGVTGSITNNNNNTSNNNNNNNAIEAGAGTSGPSDTTTDDNNGDNVVIAAATGTNETVTTADMTSAVGIEDNNNTNNNNSMPSSVSSSPRLKDGVLSMGPDSKSINDALGSNTIDGGDNNTTNNNINATDSNDPTILFINGAAIPAVDAESKAAVSADGTTATTGSKNNDTTTASSSSSSPQTQQQVVVTHHNNNNNNIEKFHRKHVRRTSHFDAHRFEKISNIVKQFKLSCGKAQSQFQGMEVKNSRFSAFIDAFTANTYIMVIVSNPNVHTASTLLNIQNARNHFERFIPRI